MYLSPREEVLTTEVIWDLFVDESGDFDEPFGKVVVLGLGLKRGSNYTNPEFLKEYLKKITEPLPWPVHNTLLRKNCIYVLAPFALRIRAIKDACNKNRRAVKTIIEGDNPQDMENAKKAIRDAISDIAQDEPNTELFDFIRKHGNEILDQPNISLPQDIWAKGWANKTKANNQIFDLISEKYPTEVGEVTNAIANREEPNHEHLVRLDRVLKNSGLLEQLRPNAYYSIAYIRRLLETLSQPDADGLPNAFICCAGESKSGNFYPPGSGSDRYLSLLEAMFNRVAEILYKTGQKTGDRQEVFLHVCTRSVLDPLYPTSTKVILNEDHIKYFCEKINKMFTDYVSLQPHEVKKYKDTEHPGFGLVDYLANFCRVNIKNLCLTALEKRIASACGIKPRFQFLDKTSMQAGGEAWEFLDCLRNGKKVMLPRKIWRWAVDQAIEWGILW